MGSLPPDHEGLGPQTRGFDVLPRVQILAPRLQGQLPLALSSGPRLPQERNSPRQH